MRRPLFIAMIFLLLLRGWVGDAMATGMAAGQLHVPSFATEIIAVQAHEARADGHSDHQAVRLAANEPLVHLTAPSSDCNGHAAGQTSDPIAQEAGGHCESCAACQACHAVALSPLACRTASAAAPPALPQSPAARFASAVAALGQKPPIS